MRKTSSEFSKIGLRFDNTYARLPKILSSHLFPVPVKIPKLIILNHLLAKELGLDFSGLDDDGIASLFAGNLHPLGSKFIAQA